MKLTKMTIIRLRINQVQTRAQDQECEERKVIRAEDGPNSELKRIVVVFDFLK